MNRSNSGANLVLFSCVSQVALSSHGLSATKERKFIEHRPVEGNQFQYIPSSTAEIKAIVAVFVRNKIARW